MHVSKLIRIASLLFLAGFFASFAHAKDHPCTASPSEQDAVVQTIRTMYAAATKDDLDLFHTVIAPDFYIFDGGRQYQGDAIMDLMKQLHAKGMVFLWTVNDPTVHIACKSAPQIAWITYVNRGSVTDAAGKTTPLQWLESAVLEKQSGQWRIRFFHSTRVPAPPPQ